MRGHTGGLSSDIRGHSLPKKRCVPPRSEGASGRRPSAPTSGSGFAGAQVGRVSRRPRNPRQTIAPLTPILLSVATVLGPNRAQLFHGSGGLGETALPAFRVRESISDKQAKSEAAPLERPRTLAVEGKL